MHARTQQLKEAYGFDIYQHTAETGRGWVVAQTHLAYLYPAFLLRGLTRTLMIILQRS